MPQYYRVKVDGTKVYLVDNKDEPLSPQISTVVGQLLIDTQAIPVYVYIGLSYEFPNEWLWKIGKSINPKRRSYELKISIVHQIECLPYGDVSATKLEAALHTLFTLVGRHDIGEWFYLLMPDVKLMQRITKGVKDTLVAVGSGLYYAQEALYHQHQQIILTASLVKLTNEIKNLSYSTPENYNFIQDNILALDDKTRVHQLQKSKNYWKPIIDMAIKYRRDYEAGFKPEIYLIYLADLWRHHWSQVNNEENRRYFSNLYEKQMNNYLSRV